MFNVRSRLDALHARRAAVLVAMEALMTAAESADRTLTGDETKRFDALEAEVRDIDAHVAQVQAVERAAANARPVAPGLIVGRGAGNSRNVRDALAESGLIARALASGLVGRAELALSLRDVLGSGGSGVTTPATGLAPVNGVASVYNRLINFIPAVPASSASVLYNRLKLDGSSPQGPGIQTEGQPKLQVGINSVPDTEAILTFAGWERISTQILADEPRVAGVVEAIIRAAVLDLIDGHAYDVMTTSLNYTAFTPQSGETLWESASRIAVALASKGAASIIVGVNPDDALTASLTRTDSGSGLYLGPPATLARPGLRVVESGTVESGKIIAFAADGTGPQYADRESMSVALGLSGADFIENMRTMLVEARGVAIIRDPGKVYYGDATSA